MKLEIIADAGKRFNIASYALLTLIGGAGLRPSAERFRPYVPGFDRVREQLTGTPKPLPKMHLNPNVKDLFSFKFEDFELTGYEADSHIKAPVAV